MKDVCWSCTERICQPDEARREIQGRFGSDAWFLLEQPSRFLAGRLDSLPDDWTEAVLACTVFDAQAELRVERDGQGLAMRIVTEGQGENKGLARHSSYLLAHHELAKPLAQGGNTTLSHVEYFAYNAESGMPEFALGRLCGVGGPEHG